jgi:nucleoside-diphosphate-sugar epimerase
MARILVAGAAGFIGSHLCDTLLDQGNEVVAVDNFITGRSKNLEAAGSRGLVLVDADINDMETLRTKLQNASPGPFAEIYNLASPASPVDFSKMPIFILETATHGHKNLLKLACEYRARILFASTSEVYGDALEHPQSESYFGNVNTIGHRGCYDEAKRVGEALSVAYARQHGKSTGIEVRIARIFNTYGPRMRPDDGRIIPNFFVQALQKQSLTVYGDGSQTRSFCFVSDLVSGLVALMASPEQRPVNIGNPIERKVIEIASTINELTHNTAPVRYLPLPENDPKQRRPDIRRAKEILNWEPKIELAEGLQACLNYFKQELAENPSGILAPTLGEAQK